MVYLNREGARLVTGQNDASRNRASLVAAVGADVIEYPPYSGSHTRWKALVKCARAKFARYDVTIVDQRPVARGYMMVMIGGTPSVLGAARRKHRRTTGLAPFNGENVEEAVVFVFSAAMKNSTRATCETLGHEVAHAYGLDHAYHCRSLMTYKRACGTKRFLDEEVPCGELKKRKCIDGVDTQNAHARLIALLGPRPPAGS